MSNGILVCERIGADAVTWAGQMIRQSGGPLVRAVVVVDPETPAVPSIEARYPRLVIRMNRPAAIGFALPNDWDRFFVVEIEPQLRVTACRRTGMELCCEPLNIPTLEDLDAACRLFGITHCAVVSGLPFTAFPMAHLFERIERLGSEDWVEGASKYAAAGEIRSALAARPTPWYEEAIGPLLLRIAGRTAQVDPFERPFFLSTADETGEVSERPYLFENGSFRALAMAEPPTAVRAFNQRYLDYEQQAATSLHKPSAQSIANALAIHPWVNGYRTAKSLADTLWRHFSMLSEGEDQMQWLN